MVPVENFVTNLVIKSEKPSSSFLIKVARIIMMHGKDAKIVRKRRPNIIFFLNSKNIE
jgi:hypothetical protein